MNLEQFANLLNNYQRLSNDFQEIIESAALSRRRLSGEHIGIR